MEGEQRKMKLITPLFPSGVNKALTMSYDDGQEYDIRLAELFRQYGIKGTFHLNSGRLGEDGFIKKEQISIVYKGHEVSVHGVNHAAMTQINDISLLNEIANDKKELEQLCGYIVRGMSYPYGAYNSHVIEMAKHCGMEYSRTVYTTNEFFIPDDFMQWHPTAHHDNPNLRNLWEQFLQPNWSSLLLFYVWGHSFEFERNNNWNQIEEFCKIASGKEEVWYATNIEIKEYMMALRNLVYSTEEDIIYNPSAQEVWICAEKNPICILAGQTIKIA